MKTIENFTTITVGSAVPFEGVVSLCPRCGRTGVLEYLADDVPEFVHVETEEVLGDGMLVQPVDSCFLPA